MSKISDEQVQIELAWLMEVFPLTYFFPTISIKEERYGLLDCHDLPRYGRS